MMFAQCFKVTVLPSLYHIKMIWAANEGNAARTRPDKMRSGLLCGLITVGNHLRKHIRQTGSGKENHRDAHVMQLNIMPIVHGVLRKTGDDTVHMHGDKILNGLFFPLMALMAVAADDRITEA